jgi:hypothetical protein
MLIRLPDTFPSTRKFTIRLTDGVRIWLTGSMMGLDYDAPNHKLYVDCLEHECWIEGMNGPLAAGFHALLEGSQVVVVETGPGTRNELWQFVPSLVATPTPTPTVTPNLAATQLCGYNRHLGTPCAPSTP